MLTGMGFRGLAGHNDYVHIRMSATGILSKLDPGHCTREVVVGNKRLQFCTPQKVRDMLTQKRIVLDQQGHEVRHAHLGGTGPFSAL